MFGDFNSEFGREKLLCVAGSGSPWKLEGALCTLDVSLEGTLFRCEISTQRTDIGLCDQLFDLLWDEGENVILSLDDSPGVFPPELAAPRLYYMGLLEVTGVHFDAIVRSLLHAGKSLIFGIEPMMSDVTAYGHKISMTTSARSWGSDIKVL